MEIARGDIVVAVLAGDRGKGRPALVVQSNAFNATHASIVVCPITSHLVEAPLFRIALAPSAETGLEAPSQVMVDKMMAIRRERIASVIGRVDAVRMKRIDHALQLWLVIE
ncbi:MAG: type II toxin-antitoxin system PemK/MazF family toxin [Bryobacteraceae bacterium]|jgi:mRNA interferase MazF